ncbi:MAG: hypothetical protein KDA44_09445 [Planctomycetales bacterium]|nr:hypothetical protein [Planctomycetales bacterium]
MAIRPPKQLTNGPNLPLRAYHWWGRRVIKVIGGGPADRKRTYGDGAVQDLCDELTAQLAAGKLCDFAGQPLPLPRLTLTSAYQARRFALRYDDRQLKVLCDLGQGGQGAPLTVSHVLRLLQVSEGRLRNKLARSCSRDAWPVKRLADEIRVLQPRHAPRGGWKPRPAEDIPTAVAQLKVLTEQWLRRSARVFGDGKQTPGCRVTDLGRKVAAALKDAQNQMNQLDEALDAKLKKDRKRVRASRG